MARNNEKKISQKYCVHTIEFWKLTQSNNCIFSSIESQMIHPSFLGGFVLADQIFFLFTSAQFSISPSTLDLLSQSTRRKPFKPLHISVGSLAVHVALEVFTLAYFFNIGSACRATDNFIL